MTSPWTALLSALFLWWFSTGAILCAVRRADAAGAGAHLRLTLLALPLAGFGAVGLVVAQGGDGAAFSYLGFVSALAVWGWIELAFLTGIVAGPSRLPWRGGHGGGARFAAAWATVAWHECLLTAVLALIWLHAAGAETGTGGWTFTVLYGARISAKLNLFCGVPRINTEFLPRPLAHLDSHLRRGPVSWIFPVSILALTLASLVWLQRLAATGAPHDALLAALTLLALLEHWLMVLPLPDAKLWRWMMPARPDPTLADRETRHGL